MCLEAELNLKWPSSLSLGKYISYICVLPWFFEGFRVQLVSSFVFCKSF